MQMLCRILFIALVSCCTLSHCAYASPIDSTLSIPKNANGTNQFNLVVYGATPGGIACAVRAAREGLTVELISHSDHLGGMFTNGIEYHGYSLQRISRTHLR